MSHIRPPRISPRFATAAIPLDVLRQPRPDPREEARRCIAQQAEAMRRLDDAARNWTWTRAEEPADAP